MISKKKKIFLSSLGMIGSFAFVTPIVSSQISNNYVISNEIITSDKQVDQKDETTSNSNIEVLNLGTNGLTEKQQTIIKALYKSKPSNISTELSQGDDLQPIIASNSIYNIIKFDDTKVYGPKDTDPTKRPKIVNISNAEKALNFKENSSSTSDTVVAKPDTDLKFFMPIKDSQGNNTFVNQNLLDYYGLLILRVEYTLKSTNVKGYEYLWISGFYSTLDRQFSSDNPTISGTEYSKSVSQVSNSDLVNYPQFDGENKPTNRVLENRNNDSRTGSINYKVNFKYDFNNLIQIDEKAISSTAVLNKYPTSTTNKDNIVAKHATSYSKEFLLKGFQPAPNISTEGIILILSIIISSGVGLALIIYFSSIILRKIRFRNSW